MARSPHQDNLLRLRANDSTLNTLLLNGNDSEGEEWGAAIENNTALTTLRISGEMGNVMGKALGAALETNTALTTLRLHGKLNAMAAEALGAALETNTTLTTLHFDGQLSSSARELFVDFDMRRILRQ